MVRFHEGEQVLISRWFDRDLAPMPTATVTKLYGNASMVYDYVVSVGAQVMSVRDSWLVGWDYVIHESEDFTDLCFKSGDDTPERCNLT